MELSKRLSAVAGLVTEGASVADIGTDHAYIPIYLIEKGTAGRAAALDIKEGPLERAERHIREHGLSGKIKLMRSDGLQALKPGEADTVIAAGMGGALTVRILAEGKRIADTVSTFILQPQSEIWKVRRYLNENGMHIAAEDMVEEDGKYYPVMKAVHGEEEHYEEWEYLFGKRLLEQRHPVLFAYLLQRKDTKEQILERLKQTKGSRRAGERVLQLERELCLLRSALGCYRR